MSLQLFNIDEETKKNIPKLFDRTEESLEEDVQAIGEWLKTQRHLPEIMDKNHIRNFLLMNKCSVEKTKQKIDMYYTIRSVIPDLFEKSNPKFDEMRGMLDLVYFCVHPKAIDGMYRVFFMKQKVSNNVPIKELIIHTANLAELRLCDDVMVGEIVVYDMANVGFNDVMKLTPSLAAKLFTICEKVYSLRLKAFYLINCPSYATIVVNLLKSFLKPKLFNRVHVCQDSQVLNQLFSEDELPEDYGGSGPSLQKLNEAMMAKFDQHQARFDQLDEMRVDESLRPQKLDNDEILGFHGNFKKLNVD